MFRLCHVAVVNALSPPSSSSSSGCSSAVKRELFGGWSMWRLLPQDVFCSQNIPSLGVFVGKSIILVLTSDGFVIFSVCCWLHFPVCINFAFSLVNNARKMRVKSIMTVWAQRWGCPCTAACPSPALEWPGSPKRACRATWMQPQLLTFPVQPMGRTSWGAGMVLSIIFTRHIIALARAGLKSI